MSSSITIVPVTVTTIKVRNPAEWRLLDRSQPITAEMTAETKMRNMIEYTFMLEAQLPSSDAIGSVVVTFVFSLYAKYF